jgi:GntR family transcriptional regulator
MSATRKCAADARRQKRKCGDDYCNEEADPDSPAASLPPYLWDEHLGLVQPTVGHFDRGYRHGAPLLLVLDYDSTMIELHLDRHSSVALHLQVAAEIRRAIGGGEAKPGDRLPPAVDFATVLGVNKNTVIRALHILRDEGILDFTRGRGVRVVGTAERSAVLARVGDLLTYARQFGYQPDDVAAMIASQS